MWHIRDREGQHPHWSFCVNSARRIWYDPPTAVVAVVIWREAENNVSYCCLLLNVECRMDRAGPEGDQPNNGVTVMKDRPIIFMILTIFPISSIVKLDHMWTTLTVLIEESLQNKVTGRSKVTDPYILVSNCWWYLENCYWEVFILSSFYILDIVQVVYFAVTQLLLLQTGAHWGGWGYGGFTVELGHINITLSYLELMLLPYICFITSRVTCVTYPVSLQFCNFYINLNFKSFY